MSGLDNSVAKGQYSELQHKNGAWAGASSRERGKAECGKLSGSGCALLPSALARWEISTVLTRAQSRKGRIPVCLVERNPLAVDYLRIVLESDQEFELLSEDSTLRAPRACEIPTPIFVIDTGTLPDPLVVYLTVLRSRFPEARILLLGGEPSANELRRFLFLEVKGFVPYHDVKNRLALALQAVSRGDAWFAPELLDEFTVYSKSPRFKGEFRGPGHGMFTPREELVLGLLNRRLGNKEIASALGVRERTIRFHLANIFRKLGVHDRHAVADVTRSGRRILVPSEKTAMH